MKKKYILQKFRQHRYTVTLDTPWARAVITTPQGLTKGFTSLTAAYRYYFCDKSVTMPRQWAIVRQPADTYSRYGLPDTILRNIMDSYIAALLRWVRDTKPIPATLWRDHYQFRKMVMAVRELALHFRCLDAVKQQIPWLMQ